MSLIKLKFGAFFILGGFRQLHQWLILLSQHYLELLGKCYNSNSRAFFTLWKGTLIYIFYGKYYVHKIFKILSQQSGRLLLWTKSNFISGFKLELITTYNWNLLWKCCENNLNVALLIFYNQNGKDFLRFVNEQGFIPPISTLFNFVHKLTKYTLNLKNLETLLFEIFLILVK